MRPERRDASLDEAVYGTNAEAERISGVAEGIQQLLYILLLIKR
jgi:hypothetical protein